VWRGVVGGEGRRTSFNVLVCVAGKAKIKAMAPVACGGFGPTRVELLSVKSVESRDRERRSVN
jgi:hypothetical protein